MLQDSINSIAFILTISWPTCITEESSSLIDNIIVNKPSNYKSEISNFDLTDNLPTLIIQNFFLQGQHLNENLNSGL